MVFVPYSVSGVVYDTYLTDSAQTTVCGVNTQIRAYNVTNKEYLDWTNANSSGQYTIDLANFTSGYVNGDVVFLEIRINSGVTFASISYRLEVDTGVGSASQDAYLLGGWTPDVSCQLINAYSYNNFTTAGHVKFYERYSGRLILAQAIGLNALGINSPFNSHHGLHANKGFFRVASVKTLDNWVVWR